MSSRPHGRRVVVNRDTDRRGRTLTRSLPKEGFAHDLPSSGPRRWRIHRCRRDRVNRRSRCRARPCRRATAVQHARYKRYQNPRFKFTVYMPRTFRGSGTWSNDPSSGANWHNRARTVSVFVAGYNNTTKPRLTAKQALRTCVNVVRGQNGKVTYRYRGGHVAACSGTEGRSIWYEHDVVYRHTYYIIWWRYKAKTADRIDPLVRHSVKTFKPGLRHFA